MQMWGRRDALPLHGSEVMIERVMFVVFHVAAYVVVLADIAILLRRLGK